jgi:hypothetical protein
MNIIIFELLFLENVQEIVLQRTGSFMKGFSLNNKRIRSDSVTPVNGKKAGTLFSTPLRGV